MPTSDYPTNLAGGHVIVGTEYHTTNNHKTPAALIVRTDALASIGRCKTEELAQRIHYPYNNTTHNND